MLRGSGRHSCAIYTNIYDHGYYINRDLSSGVGVDKAGREAFVCNIYICTYIYTYIYTTLEGIKVRVWVLTGYGGEAFICNIYIHIYIYIYMSTTSEKT